MSRRWALRIVALAGLILILLPIVFGFWGKTAAVHGMVKSFGPGYQPAAMQQSREDSETISAFAVQLQKQALPGLAKQLHTTPAALSANLGKQYPAVGKGLAEMPTALAWFGNLGQRITSEKGDYEKAAAIPAKGVPATAIPWVMVGIGAILLACALLALYVRPKAVRALATVAVVIGAVLVIVPLATSLPAKATAVNHLVAVFRPILTPPGPAKTAKYVADMSAMGTSFTQQALPGLAKELHMSVPQLQQGLATQYPAVGKGLQQLPAILPRFAAMSKLINENVGNYRTAERLPWKGAPAITLLWFLLVPGVLAAVGGALALVLGRQRVVAKQQAEVTAA
jgi:hypothetical protein